MDTEPTIFVCKPKAISSHDKAKLTKLGVVVIEMDEPKEFKLIKAGVEIAASGLMMAALEALNSQSGVFSDNTITPAGRQREKFMQLMLTLLKSPN